MAFLLAMCFVCTFVLVTEGQNKFSEGSKVGNERQLELNKRGSAGEMLEALLDRDQDDRCFGRRCQHPEECCKGATCVDIEGVSGTCLPAQGRQLSYQSCRDDSDCGVGLSCSESGGTTRTCQLDTISMHKKGFYDECVSSSECDADRGLCCQILRRHRMAARRVCHYFLDPKSCVGQVNTDAKEPIFVANPFFKARLG